MRLVVLMRYWQENWKRGLVVSLGALGIFYSGYRSGLYLLSQPPVVVVSSYEDDGIAALGGDLNFINKVTDNAPCMTIVARWLWRPDPLDLTRVQVRAVDDTFFAPPPVTVSGQLLFGSPNTMRLSIPEPKHIEPGWWNTLNEAIDVCRDGIHAPRYVRGKQVLIEELSSTGSKP